MRKLASIPHENPEAMLPASFADGFFRHESNKGITALRNPKDVRLKIDSMKKKLEAAEKPFDNLHPSRPPDAPRSRKSRTHPVPAK